MYFRVIGLLNQFIKIVVSKNVWKSSLEQSDFDQTISIDSILQRNSTKTLDTFSIIIYPFLYNKNHFISIKKQNYHLILSINIII